MIPKSPNMGKAMLAYASRKRKRVIPGPWRFRRQYVRCGKPGCWCGFPAQLPGSDRPKAHGPYWYAIRRLPDGRTEKRYLGRGSADIVPDGPDLLAKLLDRYVGISAYWDRRITRRRSPR
jgi:hypothetical protein